MKKTILSLLVIFLFGCSSVPSASIPSLFDINSKNGLFFGSISIPKDDYHYSSYNLYFKKINEKERNKNIIFIRPNFVFNKKTFTPDFETEKEYIFLFAFERVPGNYEFSKTLIVDSQATLSTFLETPKYSIPFSIKAGEISYVGNYNLLVEKNVIEISDRYKETIEVMINKYRGISWISSENKTPNFSDKNFIIIK